MLLCEQERNSAAEQTLINVPTAYQTSSQTLTTIHDYGNITVPAGGGAVIFSLDTVFAAFGQTGLVVAIQVGSLGYVAGYHYDPTLSPSTNKHLGALVWLSAGTDDISVIGLTGDPNGLAAIGIQNMQVGLVQFNDVDYYPLTLFSQNANFNIYSTVNQRATPCGKLNQAVYAINICTSGVLGSTFTISVDGVAHTDPDEQSNPQAGEAVNGYYIYKFYIPLSVGVQHTINITTGTGISGAFSMFACPWILTTPGRMHQPLNLDFSQNSTLYSCLASLFLDGVKDAYIGVKKAVTYGASDYYVHSIAEVGILSFNYTFTALRVASTSVFVDGLGGCIENIGVDIA